MPIFEYLCSKCSKRFEKLTFENRDETLCPECGSKDVKKQFSSFSSVSKSSNDISACPKGGCCPGCKSGR